MNEFNSLILNSCISSSIIGCCLIGLITFTESLGDPDHESLDANNHESLDGDIIDCLIESLGLPSLLLTDEFFDPKKSPLLDANIGDFTFLDTTDARLGRRVIKNSLKIMFK